MYQVNLGNKILYYPANDEFAIYDTELTEDIGIAGEFTFKVPPTNLLYSELSTGKLITVLKNKKEFWRGEIRDISIDFAKIATVYVVEDVAWLGDEFIPPAKIITQTYKQRLDAVIATYNSTRPSDRQFISGSVYNGADICNWQTEYEWSILDSIRKCICRDDYYVKVRRVYESGVIRRYIDIVRLQEYGKSTTQPIEYGYNLLDYVKESDYGNLTNVLTPYGEELEDSEVYTDYSARLQGNTISNNASINTYGRHAKAVVFDGVTNATTLNNLAASYLSRYSQPQLTMEVKAVDLSMIENVQDIAIGDKVRIIAKPFAVDQELYLTEIVRDLQNVDKNTLTLSGNVARKSLTNQINRATDAIEEVPTESSILKSAKRNALAMLLDETQGGYVVYEYHKNADGQADYIEAINICDMPTIAASKKRWRWSQNGLGYMYRANAGTETIPAWQGPEVAMTSDGKISADRILTGSLNADLVTVNGKIEATSGFIGQNGNNGWNIGNTSIYNGVTAVSGTPGQAGTYVGVDGIRSQGGIGNAAYVRISDGSIVGNSTISCSGLSASSVTSDSSSAKKYWTSEGSNSYDGKSGVISWATSAGGYALNIKNGIIVSIVHP
ncbi:MAG: phage tail protein [Clostridiales bacterium]|nr:phage tail protein [Clostridiales bacterium]